MPLDFPNTPTDGQIFNAAGVSWMWDGVKWTSVLSAGGPFLPLAGGSMTGPFTAPIAIGDGTGTPTLTLNGALGTEKGVQWQTANHMRWRFITDASDNLGLYAYTAAGAYNGLAMLFANDASSVSTNFPIRIATTAAAVSNAITGLHVLSHNTGANPAQNTLIEYYSTAGNSGFDTGMSNISTFDPVFIAGQVPVYQALWLVAQSPNDTTHPWSSLIGELNIVNRGADTGWLRDRTTTGTTGGWLVVPETLTFGAGTTGEGKNCTYAYAVAHSGGTNSTGFQAKFYNGLLIEPDSIVGQTGRGIYATGDITGVVSQRPYGPFQTDGTWLHGIDHTRATYTDGHAETLLAGQALAWIGGTTGSPTATATISGTVAGSVANIVMQPGGGGGVFIGAGTSAQYININGASGQNNGVNWQTAGNMRWRLITDASDLLNLYAYSAAGAFLGTVCSFEPTLCHVNVDLYASRVGFNGTAPIAKPTGYTAPTGTATRATFATTSVTLPVLAEHVKALIDDLTAYGLIGP